MCTLPHHVQDGTSEPVVVVDVVRARKDGRKLIKIVPRTECDSGCVFCDSPATAAETEEDIYTRAEELFA